VHKLGSWRAHRIRRAISVSETNNTGSASAGWHAAPVGALVGLSASPQKITRHNKLRAYCGLAPNPPLIDLDRRALDRAVGIINAVVAFLGSQPAQAGRAVIHKFGGLAAHRFPHPRFADRAGHHAVPNDALMNVPPILLFAQSLIHKNAVNLKRLQSATYKRHECIV
jgi:hypothetical protein